jgi:ribosomal-protein-alanine N-acetyltransferase
MLADLLAVNRAFLAPWEPVRPEHYFTPAGQLADIEGGLARHGEGSAVPGVIVDESGQVAGRITLNGIVRGAFQSASVGYWLSEASGGRGLATKALREVMHYAFHDLGLHRIQADTLLDNVRSQRVLERAGFVQIGTAAKYLRIAGRWQDCHLYQVITPLE